MKRKIWKQREQRKIKRNGKREREKKSGERENGFGKKKDRKRKWRGERKRG